MALNDQFIYTDIDKEGPIYWASRFGIRPLDTLLYRKGEEEPTEAHRLAVATLVYALNRHLESRGVRAGISKHGHLEQLHSPEKAGRIRHKFEAEVNVILTMLADAGIKVAAIYPLQGSAGLIGGLESIRYQQGSVTPPPVAQSELTPNLSIEATRIESTHGTGTGKTASHAQLSEKTNNADIVVLVDEIGDRMKVVLQVLRERFEARGMMDIVAEIDTMATQISIWGHIPPPEAAEEVTRVYKRIAKLCQEANVVVAVLYSKNEPFFAELERLANEAEPTDPWGFATTRMLPKKENGRSFTPDEWITGGLGPRGPEDHAMCLLDTGVDSAELVELLMADPRYAQLQDSPLVESMSNAEFLSALAKFKLRTGTVEGLHAFVPGFDRDPDAYIKFLVDMFFDMVLQPQPAESAGQRRAQRKA